MMKVGFKVLEKNYETFAEKNISPPIELIVILFSKYRKVTRNIIKRIKIIKTIVFNETVINGFYKRKKRSLSTNE